MHPALPWALLAVPPALPFAITALNALSWPRGRPAPSPEAPLRLSVLIPARDEAATIRAAVEAVFAAGGPLHEVVVFNDASTDGTGASRGVTFGACACSGAAAGARCGAGCGAACGSGATGCPSCWANGCTSYPASAGIWRAKGCRRARCFTCALTTDKDTSLSV